MKRILSCLILLSMLLTACVNAGLDDFHPATMTDILAKRRANAANQHDIYNRWYYAGSDDKYDYIYEYKKGVSISPPSNFHFYKIDRGQIESLPPRTPFHFEVGNNPEIFGY